MSARDERSIRGATGGAPLPKQLRVAAESRSGRDLSAVRVHSDSSAARLSSSMAATAFTVGSNIFLGPDAARPGTSAGDALLGHEVGHVVQQGGGVAARQVQRRSLAPLSVSGVPVVSRLLGKKKSPIDKAKKKADKSAKGSVKTKSIAELAKQVALLEGVLAKLEAHRKTGGHSVAAAAQSLVTAAEKMVAETPGATSQAGLWMGPTYPELRRRIRRVADEAELIANEFRVAATKSAAEDIYMDAGTNNKFKHLGDPTAFNSRLAPTFAQAGEVLGLSPAESAAIATYTSGEYRYMNPAVANNPEWLKSVTNRGDGIDKEAKDRTPEEQAKLDEQIRDGGKTEAQLKADRANQLRGYREEGSLHSAMALQGLAKLPPWKGTLFRGYRMPKAEFDRKYLPRPRDRRVPTSDNKQMTFTNITSASRKKGEAENFANSATSSQVGLVFEMQIINGRDVQSLSILKTEAEVVLMPGSTVSVGALERQSDGYYLAKCVQRR